MTDFHFVVINYIGQIIGGISVRLKQYQVIEVSVLKFHITPDEVGIRGLPAEGDFETDYRGYAISLFFGSFIITEVAAVTVIAGRLFSPDLFSPHFFEALRGAVTVIGVSVRNKTPSGLVIEFQALGLDVRAIVAADLRSLIPVQTHPSQATKNRLDSAFNPTGDVGIFNADDEAAAVVPGKEPGKESGPHIADMRSSGGTGGKTSSDCFSHKILLASTLDISQ